MLRTNGFRFPGQYRAFGQTEGSQYPGQIMGRGCDRIAVTLLQGPDCKRPDDGIQHGYPIVHLGQKLTPEAIKRLGETGWFGV